MLRVGAAKEMITPPLGTLLAGYPSERPATKVNDDLTVTAIYLNDEGKSALLISATILQISSDTTDCLKKKIKEEFSVSDVIICATHTHSGPITTTAAGWGDTNNEYIDSIFIPKTMEAVGKAIENVKDALVGIGCTNSDVGINRRFIKEDGGISLGENPFGIMDKKMHVIAFRTPDGEPICNIIHYGAHGTANGGYPDVPAAYYITRDWSGIMEDRLEAISGGITAFFNSAEGDVAPRLIENTRNDRLAQMTELGGRAALDALSAYKEIREYRSLSLNTFTDEIKLPYAPLEPLEKAKQEYERLPENPHGSDAFEKQKWLNVIKAHESGEKQTHFTFCQNIISIGEVAFVPFPFEHFSEIALRLSYFSPYGYTLTLSNANGSYGYLPAQTEICRGGYEIWSFKHTGAYGLADDTDTEIVKENLRILKTMKNN